MPKLPALCALVLSVPAWGATMYTITNLGVLPGGGYSVGQGVNDSGQVTGYSDSTNGTRAFLWDGSTMQDLGVLPGGSFSVGYGINNSGQVAGYTDSATEGGRAFLWDGSTMQDLGALREAPLALAMVLTMQGR